MINLKTHFEQVPLEIVRKILQQQILKEGTTVQQRGTNKEKLNSALSEAPKQSIVPPLAFAQVES
jgi:hypothetical protein